ncbi:MAG: hypothetical protein LIP77_05500, partial [Planctomycetes bacterium]|nr:hypothetical protein [Planctomycetota bacterium]
GLLGCLGLVVRAHSAITATALWTGFAVACYGVFLAERRLVAGAFWFGTGTGLAFMAKGFMGPAFLGVATLLLPVVCPVWRRFAFCRLLLWTLLFALPWLVVWPTALYLRSPELFRVWFLDNNVGRFLGPGHGFPTLVQTRGRAKYLVQFPWFMLPLWPPALVAWWRHGRREWQLPRLLFPTLVVVVGYGILAAAAGQRDLYPIPLIVPLALLAAQGCPLPGWLDRVLRQGFRIASGAALALAWCLWLGWRLGLPPVADRIDAIAPGLQNHTGVFSVAAAVLVTAAWVGLFVPVSPFRQGWAWVWAGGMAAVWGTTMLLFLPVLNHRNGYRTTFAAMIEHLPDQAGPIANHRLGESQRAILDYYFRVRTQQLRDRDTIGAYRYLLVQDHVKYPEFTPEGSWRLLWQGSRPGDERELYLLYENTAFPVGPPAVDQPADEGKGS